MVLFKPFKLGQVVGKRKVQYVVDLKWWSDLFSEFSFRVHMKNFEEMSNYLTIPSSPCEAGKGLNWGLVTNFYGKSLPTDYMMFIEYYGSGEIGGWLTVLNPFSNNTYINLLHQFAPILSSVSTLKEEFPETYPFPLLFEPGGLLPWGISIDGDIYCWSTAGVSGKWKIVVLGRHSEPEEFEVSFTSFINGLLNGSISCKAIPQEWAGGDIRFVPYTP
ncbi:SMI1/KNR4 family protein [Shewanella mangrovisoli]|uniref:SMI1/KNR4 family protein n=2 Tax=Shewanella mangrovisoli TaxID=2864211 RepID=A0ABV4VEC6_9GAMM